MGGAGDGRPVAEPWQAAPAAATGLGPVAVAGGAVRWRARSGGAGRLALVEEIVTGLAGGGRLLAGLLEAAPGGVAAPGGAPCAR